MTEEIQLEKTLTPRSKGMVAIVEDEIDIANLLALHMQRAGFATKIFQEARHFFAFLQGNVPDLVLLDLMLPDADGIDICKQLKGNRSFAHVPIVMVTAKSEEGDKILGLELGADDYITKPFSPRELVARVKAVLRRALDKPEDSIITISNILTIDLKKYEVYIEDQKVNLTTTEFRILKKLAEKKGWVFSREQLLEYLWGGDKAVIDRSIDVHINRLRSKLGKAAKLIQNMRGVGYRLDA